MPLYEIGAESIRKWTPGISAIRTTILKGLVVSTVLPDGTQWPSADVSATENDIDVVSDLAIQAVNSGRVVHLGHLPNEAIVTAGNYGGPLYSVGGLASPFEHPWIFVHTWEERGGPRATAVYLVNPVRLETGDDGGYEVVELQPCVAEDEECLIVGDRALLQPPNQQEAHAAKYHCFVVPSPYRLLPDLVGINNGKSPEAAAAGNVLDPFMAALLLLNTDGVARTTITASEKLNKARAKSGKPPIPPHDVIDSGPYVTALIARHSGQAAVPGGGHHASPIAHIRRGHFRNYATGQRTFIRETLVNVTEDARRSFVSKRSHYTAPTEGHDRA